MKRMIATMVLLAASAGSATAQATNGAAREAMAGMPESQAVLYVNARRITNEVLPRVVPAAKYQGAFDQAKTMANVDLRAVEYVLAGMRLTGDATSEVVPVEFGVVVKGGFNADALLSMARMAGQGKYRQETRGSKTINFFKVNSDDEKKNALPDGGFVAAPKPGSKFPSELAAVALDADSLLVGTAAYVAAALDARENTGGRVKAELVDLAMRNPDALVSLAGDMPPSVSKYLDAANNKGAANSFINDETKRLLDSVRQFQFSVNMTPAQYGTQTILRTDTPENARAISGLVATGLRAIEDEMSKAAAKRRAPTPGNEARALAILRSFVNTARDNELLLSVDVPQDTIASLVRENFAPAEPAKKSVARATPRRAPATRRRRG